MYFSTQPFGRPTVRCAHSEAARDTCTSPPGVFGPKPFEGSIVTRAIGRFLCSRISHHAGIATRSSCQIERSDPPEYIVLLQLAGVSHLEQLGRRVDLRPGAVTVIDSTFPSRCAFEGKNILLAFHISRPALDDLALAWVPEIAVLVGESSSTLVGALMSSAFEVVRGSDAARGDVVVRAIVSLLEGNRADRPDGPHCGRQSNVTLLRSIQDFVTGHLGDAALSPLKIARAHGVSERKVHRVFKASGLSVSQWIKQRRLDRCAAQLRDPALRSQSITEIAFRWGFNDAAHFSRAFRAEFAQTPRAFRTVASAERALTAEAAEMNARSGPPRAVAKRQATDALWQVSVRLG